MERRQVVTKISGLSGMLLPILMIALLYFALQQSPWFSWTENAISDLGRPTYGLLGFNLVLIIIGILMFVFSIGLYLSLGGERIGPSLIAISSIYFIGIGVFPLPDPTHIDVSGMFFDDQGWESLADAIIRFRQKEFDPEKIVTHAKQFDVEEFKKHLMNFVLKHYERK